MKTKVLAALVATMAVGATCAFAANPFVDVPTDSWAYKSVVELADAGIIQGVDGSYFQGDRNITRYEAAEMTAKAMAHMDKASVEQRALINKLADEYADELNSLGVRVSNLENKVGNVKLTGDARIRYIHQDSGDKGYNAATKNDSSWTYRVRLRANAQVNDRTKVTYGVSTDNVSFADHNTADSKNGDVYTDLANVDYNFGGNNWDLLVGRYTYVMGNKVGWLFGDSFDGAQLKYKNDKFAATAGYGKFKRGIIGGSTYEDKTSDDVKTAYGELEGFFGGGSMAGSSVGVYYNDLMPNFDANNVDVWGAYASFNFGHKWNLTGNYETYSNATGKLASNGKEFKDDADVWYGKLQYGTASFAAPKSWDAWVEYLNADNLFNLDSDFVGSTNLWRTNSLMNNVKSWGVGVDYTFAKNGMFSVMQTFASEAKDGDNDPGEMTRAQFVFVF